MIIGFKPQFEAPILEGIKIHTIRERNRFTPGAKLQLATGVRTKDYNCFAEKICVSTQSIEITHTKGGPFVLIDGKFINNDFNIEENKVMQQLAANDGFASIADFFKWFDINCTGTIIHWTNFKY